MKNVLFGAFLLCKSCTKKNHISQNKKNFVLYTKVVFSIHNLNLLYFLLKFFENKSSTDCKSSQKNKKAFIAIRIF